MAEAAVARAAAAAGVDLAHRSHLGRVVAIENAGTVGPESRIRRQSCMALAVLEERPAGSRTAAKSAADGDLRRATVRREWLTGCGPFNDGLPAAPAKAIPRPAGLLIKALPADETIRAISA